MSGRSPKVCSRVLPGGGGGELQKFKLQTVVITVRSGDKKVRGCSTDMCGNMR